MFNNRNMKSNIELLNGLCSKDLLDLEKVFDESKRDIEISYSSFAELEEVLDYKSLIVLRQDERIIGFLSFFHNYSIPNHLIKGKEEWSPSNLVLLVCIKSKYRNQETYKAFYDYLLYNLLNDLKCSVLTTRFG